MATVALGVLAAAQAEAKIAVVDMAELVKAHPKTKEDRAILEKQAEQYRTEQIAMLKKLKKLKEEYLEAGEEARSKALSEQARAEKKAALGDKRVELMEYEKEVRESLRRREKLLAGQERRMLERIVDRIRGEIVGYIKGKGYTLVLDRSALGVTGMPLVVHAEPRDDITDAVLKRIEALAPKTEE